MWWMNKVWTILILIRIRIVQMLITEGNKQIFINFIHILVILWHSLQLSPSVFFATQESADLVRILGCSLSLVIRLWEFFCWHLRWIYIRAKSKDETQHPVYCSVNNLRVQQTQSNLHHDNTESKWLWAENFALKQQFQVQTQSHWVCTCGCRNREHKQDCFCPEGSSPQCVAH